MWHRVVVYPQFSIFSVSIRDLLKEVEKAELGIHLGDGGRIGGMLFADDFVGLSDTKEQLQKLIDVVYSYCSKWRLKANVTKSAVMVFTKEAVDRRYLEVGRA